MTERLADSQEGLSSIELKEFLRKQLWLNRGAVPASFSGEY
jgi:hypothetical protein